MCNVKTSESIYHLWHMCNVTLSRALLLHIQLMKTIHAAIKSAMMGNMKDINLTMPSILSILQYQKKTLFNCRETFKLILSSGGAHRPSEGSPRPWANFGYIQLNIYISSVGSGNTGRVMLSQKIHFQHTTFSHMLVIFFFINNNSYLY